MNNHPWYSEHSQSATGAHEDEKQQIIVRVNKPLKGVLQLSTQHTAQLWNSRSGEQIGPPSTLEEGLSLPCFLRQSFHLTVYYQGINSTYSAVANLQGGELSALYYKTSQAYSLPLGVSPVSIPSDCSSFCAVRFRLHGWYMSICMGKCISIYTILVC